MNIIVATRSDAWRVAEDWLRGDERLEGDGETVTISGVTARRYSEWYRLLSNADWCEHMWTQAEVGYADVECARWSDDAGFFFYLAGRRRARVAYVTIERDHERWWGSLVADFGGRLYYADLVGHTERDVLEQGQIMVWHWLAGSFQSTPSAGEGDGATLAQTLTAMVSTHAFREGRRRIAAMSEEVSIDSSPSTPSAGEGDDEDMCPSMV